MGEPQTCNPSLPTGEIQNTASYTPTETLAEKGKIYYRCGAVINTTYGGFHSEESFSDVAVIRFMGENDGWEGDGTEGNPYMIRSLEDLERLRDEVNDGLNTFAGKYLKIDESVTEIVLPYDPEHPKDPEKSWVPIGIYSTRGQGDGADMRPFSGTLISNNGTVITVAKGGRPLLGACREATLIRVRVRGEEINGPGFLETFGIDYGPDGSNGGNDQPKFTATFIYCRLLSGSSTKLSGFVHGIASGMNNINFIGCAVENNVTIGYDGQAISIGSFSGSLSGVIINCSSNATVQGKTNVGGLSGNKNQSMGTCRIVNGRFGGTVVASGSYAGGIIGGGYYADSAPNTPCVSVTNCYVSGNVTGKNRVGGIFGGEAGSEQCWANGIGYIQNNLFTGKVTATDENGYKGGIIGYMNSLDRYNVISNNYYATECGADKGIGFVKKIDTSFENPAECEGANGDKTKYVTTARYSRADDPLGGNATDLTKSDAKSKFTSSSASGIVKKTLNEVKNSTGNWTYQSGVKYILNDNAIMFMDVGGKYVSRQEEGSTFRIPDGMVLNVTYMNGATASIPVAGTEGVTVIEPDMNVPGRKAVEVTYTYKATGLDAVKQQTLQAFFEYEVYEKVDESAPKINVTFSLMGDDVHGNPTAATGTHTLTEGGLQTWIAETSYTLPPNATVWDLLQEVERDKGVSFYNPEGNYVKSVTCNGTSISEFDNGKDSGWMYTLNGLHPGKGVSEQKLQDGDVLVFHYTDDYGKEEDAAIATQANLEAAKKVDDLILAIPDTVAVVDQNAVEAARKAYDALTAAQKRLVRNYMKLKKAEAALAELLATDEDRAAAAAVDGLIQAIGTPVTAGSKDAIEAARAAYDKLTDLQKRLVKNYDDLVAAEVAYRKLPEAFRSIHQAVGDYLLTKGTPIVGSIGGEWMVIGLARAGRLTEALGSGYYNNLEKFVKEKINDKEQLDKNKSTENARVILALSAMGRDATDVAGHNLLAGFTDIGYVKKQGINGPIWALIALDSRNYDAPSESVTREKLIQEILKGQLDNGGWALSGTDADPDMTGMALQALAPYYKGGRSEGKSGTDSNELNIAVERAVERLSQIQDATGGYGSKLSGDGINSESCVQVIVALTALGIDPAKDGRFTKNGKNVIDALLSFYVKDGGFRHVPEGGTDGMATEQGYYALTAYLRYLDRQSSLYDMRDVGPKKVYRIMEGTDDLWSVNEDGSVSIRADGAVADFRDLMVDGKLVDPSNYTVKSGSTIVTLKPEFLKSLGEGNHEITFVYVDGAVTMTLPLGAGGTPIRKTDQAPGGPAAPGKPLNSVGTGDKTSIALYAAALLLSAASVSALLYRKRRNERAGK